MFLSELRRSYACFRQDLDWFSWTADRCLLNLNWPSLAAELILTLHQSWTQRTVVTYLLALSLLLQGSWAHATFVSRAFQVSRGFGVLSWAAYHDSRPFRNIRHDISWTLNSFSCYNLILNFKFNINQKHWSIVLIEVFNCDTLIS